MHSEIISFIESYQNEWYICCVQKHSQFHKYDRSSIVNVDASGKLTIASHLQMNFKRISIALCHKKSSIVKIDSTGKLKKLRSGASLANCGFHLQ